MLSDSNQPGKQTNIPMNASPELFLNQENLTKLADLRNRNFNTSMNTSILNTQTFSMIRTQTSHDTENKSIHPLQDENLIHQNIVMDQRHDNTSSGYSVPTPQSNVQQSQRLLNQNGSEEQRMLDQCLVLNNTSNLPGFTYDEIHNQSTSKRASDKINNKSNQIMQPKSKNQIRYQEQTKAVK